MEKITNEQKADEICKRHIFDSNHFDCCMEMADWKDEQHKDIEEGLREIINALDANLHKSNESGLYYFNKCNILINEACKWLEKNDSYAIPTNVQVDRLREYLNNIK